MRALLAWSSLRRHPLRTALAILGVAVSAAMLLDMVMLSSGMQVSFRALLTRQGFEVRLTPKGTLPFDTEARIAGAASAESVVRRLPGVQDVSPVLGTTLHVVRGANADAVFALGIRPAAQGDYTLERGTDAVDVDRMVANATFLTRAGLALGDSVVVAAGYDAQLHMWTARRRVVIAGEARFHYLATDQPAVALPLATAQALVADGGGGSPDQVSLLMVKTHAGVDAEALRRRIEREVPRVTAIATADAVKSVEQRLGYFRQLALILGSVSLAVGFLLVSTLVTVSVQERVGEMAVMRALGVSRPHIAQQVMLEGLAISVVGAAGGLALGLVTARYLNTILRAFPGLPAAIDFFVFEPTAAYKSFALLIVTAVLAGVVPAWRAGSLPIAATLRTEAVS
ncbi:MAG: FtsX-like permease family protein [Gemmatimonadota bacterium]